MKILIGLVFAVVGSALSTVLIRYENRQVFLEVRGAEIQRDRLNDEWGKLQLEQATWSLHSLIAFEAREKLGMVPPDPQDTVVLRLESSR